MSKLVKLNDNEYGALVSGLSNEYRRSVQSITLVKKRDAGPSAVAI
jgi:hypothetical protein